MGLSVNLYREKYISFDRGKTWDVEYDELYWANITHNLTEMSDKAGIYEALWRPYMLKPDYTEFEDYDKEMEFEDSQTVLASELIEPLEKGLADLKKRPDYFRKFNPSNGWGSYEGLVAFVEKYIRECKANPNAVVSVSR